MLPHPANIQKVQETMKEVFTLEALLHIESDGSKNISIKASIQKLLTAQGFIKSLNALEVKGLPTWGLSCEERDLIIDARAKVNEYLNA